MNKQYTNEELNNIINDYKNGMRPKDLSIKYNRSSGTIIGKLKTLGIYVNKNTRFSEDDIAFLKEYYPKGDFEKIFKRFPNSSKQSICNICHKYNIKADYYNKHKWTNEDLKILKDNYYTKTLEEISEMINYRHSTDAINSKALKYFNYSKDRTWTDEEIKILKENYSLISVDDMVKILPKRTRQAIIKKANLLNIKSSFTLTFSWNDEDTKYLIDNWEYMSDNELAMALKKNKDSIAEKRLSLRLLRQHRYNEASYENLQKYIRGNINTWKKDSMKKCNYQCVLTGSKNFEIHHIYSFSKILLETIEENNLVLKDNFCDYTPQELSFILEKFTTKQNEYPLGVCIDKELHKQFHLIYGKDVGQNQWIEFCNNYERDKIT